MRKGDIVLVPFPFTDLRGSKKRPALVLVGGSLDVTVCFISTQLHWEERTDLCVSPKRGNGLKKKSLVKTSKIATIDKDLVIGKLGALDRQQIDEWDSKLIVLFDIQCK